MNIQHLRYFLAVMETGSVSRAADALGVTQPTLSVALKRIEQEFGTRLFAPDGRGIKPLPGAKLLEDRIRPIVRALSDAKRDLAGAAPSGLKIGILQSLAEIWVPRLVNNWDGPVAITEGLASELDQRLADGTLDMALTTLPTGNGLRSKVLLRESYMLFVGAMHALAGRRMIRLADLDGEPFILRQCCERLGTGRRLLNAARVRFRVVAKTRQEATAAALVTAGIGSTLAARSWHRPGMHAIEVTDLRLERTIVLTWKSSANAVKVASVASKLEAPAARHVRGDHV